MNTGHATTRGTVRWGEMGFVVQYVDHPIQPEDGDDWRLVCSSIVKNRNGEETILWFWEREVEAVT